MVDISRPMLQKHAFELSLEKQLKIRHLYFHENEYIEVLPNNLIRYSGQYITSVKEFWLFRTSPAWESDWEIF